MQLNRVLWKSGTTAVIVLGIGLVFSSFLFAGIGNWLIIDDALKPAYAVVVFGGQLPFRAMEAASIYKRGLVSQVWLTEGGIYPEDLALARLGVDHPDEHFYSRQVLERLGVPSEAIRLVKGHNLNTADEVRTVARELKSCNGDRAILITSKYHARRVKVLWRKLVGDRPEAIVRYTPDDPFQAARWWRNTADASSVAHELFGLANAWAGFPIKSERW